MKLRPRIGLDLHVVSGKYQGSRTHVIELFSRVIENSPDIDFILITEDPDLLRNSAAAFSSANTKIIRLRNFGPIVRLNVQLPQIATRLNLDAIHTQYMIPFPLKCSRIVTIHDILFETHPQYFSRLFNLRSRIFIRLAAKRADHVVTVSEYSKSEISARYHVDSRRVSVIYNGVDVEHFGRTSDGDAAILESLGLASGQYILSVGRLEPRKNHSTLVRAYAGLGASAPPLIIVGQRDFGYGPLFKCIAEMGLCNRVKLLEDINDKALPAIYRGACLFAYPSIAEGFGIPLVEAMAAGVPVVATDSTAIKEIVGGAAELAAPLDTKDLEMRLSRVLWDPQRAAELRLLGRAQASKFNWHSSAVALRQLYLGLTTGQSQ